MNRSRCSQIRPLRFLGLVFALIWTVATASQATPRITQLTASGEDGQFSSPFTGFGTAVAIRGDTAWVGIPLYVNSASSSTQSGRVGIFTLDESTGAWNRSGSLDVSDQGSDEDRFGSTIVLREHDAAVGSYGAVRIYSRKSQGWQELAKIASDASNHVLGPVLAYDGDTLAVQVTETQSPQAFVYVYEIDRHGTPHLAVKLSPPPDDSGAFGSSLALDRNTLLVGSPAGHSTSPPSLPPGMVYVYSRQGKLWDLVQSLTGPVANGDFGAAVAIHRDISLVGAPFEDPVTEDSTGYTDAAGAVYVFQREYHGPWLQTQRVRPTEQDEGVGRFNSFGLTLAMDDERVAIGAPFTTDPFQDDLGQTDVYRWQGDTLVFEQKVQAYPSPGFALSMRRNRLIIGVNAFVHSPINEAWIVDYGGHARQ